MTEPIINSTDYAYALLEWQGRRQELDALEAEIKAYALKQEKSSELGDVKVTYTKGRRTFDYKAAVEQYNPSPEIMALYQKLTYDYKAICEGTDIKDIPFTEGAPSVTIKLVT